jgi:hypothetical protein
MGTVGVRQQRSAVRAELPRHRQLRQDRWAAGPSGPHL